MVECNSIESIKHNSIDTSNLNNQQFKLDKISEIEDYFMTEIKERELMSKKLIEYISFFDKSLIVLSVTSVAFLLHRLQQLLEYYRYSKRKSWIYIFMVYRTGKKIIKSNKK